MDLNTFTYALPDELIAQKPLAERDKARLLVIDRKSGTIHADIFSSLPKYLPKKSLVVVNNSKVIPARILGTKERSGGRVEIFLLKSLNGGSTFETFLKPFNRLRDNDRIDVGQGVWAEIVDRQKRTVRFNRKNILKFLPKIGHTPLPPYIRRTDTPEDAADYQTVYARVSGSVASPTAGLHFTRGLLRKLKTGGHTVLPVTLHVNRGTFQPVTEQDITQHKMHSEEYSVSPPAWGKIERAKKAGRPIVAVGTTSGRVLEAISRGGKLQGRTDIFIYPGFKFHLTDILVTNFHLPRSTLLMLVYAFGGTALMKKAYACAIEERFRFYSYGDAMIIF